MKKFMALLLTLAMTASFAAVPAMAKDEDVKLKITPNVTSVDTTGEAEVTYTIGVEVKNSDVKIGSIQFNLNPPEGMTLGTTKQDYKVTSALFYNEDFNPDGILIQCLNIHLHQDTSVQLVRQKSATFMKIKP